MALPNPPFLGLLRDGSHKEPSPVTKNGYEATGSWSTDGRRNQETDFWDEGNVFFRMTRLFPTADSRKQKKKNHGQYLADYKTVYRTLKAIF